MEPQEIKAMIERGLPGAHVEVRDFTGGGDHFEALVVSESFEGKGLAERHQAVYGALGDAVKSYSNWPTIPQVFINGKFVGGCDIVREMHSSGELQTLVKAALSESA